MKFLLSFKKALTLAAALFYSYCFAQTAPVCSVSLPYNEGFNASPVGSCWSQAQTSTPASSYAAITAVTSGTNPSASPFEGDYMLRFNSYNAASTVQTRIMSSPFNTTGISSVDVEYYWYNSNSGSSYNDRVQLQYSLNGTTWVSAGSEVLRYNATNGWVKKSVTLPAAAGNQSKVYVAFLFISGNGYNCYLDNISVKKTATCFPGTMAATQNITSGSATINWAAPAAAPANGYEYYYSTAATPPAPGTAPLGATPAGITTAAIAGLSANTMYYTWVRSACSTSDKSDWSTAATFTTACSSVNTPYTQNFDSAATMPGCSVVQDSNADAKTWAVQTSSAYAASGNNSLRYTYGSTAANDWWFTPGINLTAGSTYKITFAYRAYATAYPEALEVKTGTAQSAAGMAGMALFSNGAITNGSYITASINYTAAVTGVQYFGWHATSSVSGFYLYIDDISVTALPDCSTVAFPAAIAAIASKTSICTSEALTFSLNASIPDATGITYQWKSSADGITYTNTGTAQATPIAVLTANENNRWFKCDVLCNGTAIRTALAVEIAVNVSILGTTSGTRCGPGTVQLGVTSQAGNSAKWYASTNSATALATGTTFTTPQIAHTTTYYAAAAGTAGSYTAGPATPQSVSASYGSNNNGEGVIFNVASPLNLTSVTVYPVDAAANNVIYLKDASGAILKQLTFSTMGTSPLSSTSGVGAPFIINLNWDIPAGNGYKLAWGTPDFYGANRLLRNSSGATGLYTANNGITFTGNDSGNGNTYWFYFYNWKFTTGCGESAIRVPVTATVNYEWTGAADTDWGNPANWCGSALPGLTDAISIVQTTPGPVVAAGTVAYAKSLALQNGANVTVATGGTLWVADAVTVAESAHLTVQDNGALVQVNDIQNTGAATVNKKGNPLYRLDYTLWSSPVSGQSLLGFSPATSANRFYTYVPTPAGPTAVTGHYQVVVDPAATTFADGKSYLIRMPNTGTPAYNAGTGALAYQGTFTGTPHNGTISVALDDTGDRYTAIGNPYPSPISVADFFAANSTSIEAGSAIYLWRKRNNSANASYATLTLSGYVANLADGGGAEQATFFPSGNPANWLLAQGQGFFVKAGTASLPVVQFTNSMRRAMPGSTQAFFKSAPGQASRLWLNIYSSNGNSGQLAVSYQPEGTIGLDYGYDGKTLTDGAVLSFYSIVQNTALAIQARPAFNNADVVLLGYKALNPDSFTIAVDHTEGVFSNGQDIYLKDSLLGLTHNLTQSGYTFTTEAGTVESRFQLVYMPQASLSEQAPLFDANRVMVYKQANTLTINAGSAIIQSITIRDIRGRKVYSKSGINNVQTVISGLDLTQEVLILEINTNYGAVSKRIVY